MIFDTHAHYYDKAFSGDVNELLASLPERGVGLVVCPGCDIETSTQCVKLAQLHPHVYAAVGIHPEEIETHTLKHMDDIATLANQPKVVAIGEAGLDYYWIKEEALRAQSRDLFDAHLSLSEEKNLPLIVHARDAQRDTMDIVKAHPNARGVFHCYAGSLEEAKILVDMGWMISFTGNVTFKNARKAPEILKWIPLESLLLETDAPYMAPEPFRGKRCDSSMISYAIEAIAAWRNMDAKEVEEITYHNGKAFFGL